MTEEKIREIVREEIKAFLLRYADMLEQRGHKKREEKKRTFWGWLD